MSTVNIPTITTSPEIETLYKKLDEIEMRENVYKAAEKDAVVSMTERFDPVTGVNIRTGYSRKGFVYTFSMDKQDWVRSSIPPMPGTPARSFYDERKSVYTKINILKAGREIIPDDVKDLVDPVPPIGFGDD